jgi:hypothetical protein
MATYTVTKVRKEYSTDRSHRHIEGVITTTGSHHTRRQVVDSIDAGNTRAPDMVRAKLAALTV